ncbi:MAG TPA: alpha/beta fold hydrolase [Flavobacterium sp.]|nr:alpha/beta fold hydrolase [Flavobacterium sp.]
MRLKRYLLLILVPLAMRSQNEHTIDSGDSTLHFRTFGTGKPLLIINGGPGMNSEGFSGIAAELSKLGYQAITYDQRGTGQSIVPKIDETRITMDLMASDMENLRKHLKIEKWSLLGHSFGGIMAAYYATKYPTAVDKIIFSSSGGIDMDFTTYIGSTVRANLTKTQRDSLDYYQSKRESGDLSIETLKNRARFLANAYVYDKSKAPTIAARLIQINFDVNRLVINNLHKIGYDCAKSFSHFKQPVLVLQGKNDIIKIRTAQAIARAFPNSKLVLMDRCAHYGWLDVPKIYMDTVKSFLNS